MKFPIVWFSVLVILSNKVLGNDIDQPAQSKRYTVFNERETYSKSVERLQTKLKSQTIALSDYEANAKTQENSLNNLETKVDVHGTMLSNLEALLRKLEANMEIQAATLKELETKEDWQEPIAQFPTNRTIIAPEGDDVEILCVVHGIPLPEIRWTRENASLESDRVVVENYGNVLRIKNARLNDQGSYVCVAANGVGTPVTQSVRLQVYGKRSISNDQRLEKTVDGILAGTDDDGAFVIPFNASIRKVVHSGLTFGVTYDWNSGKIYYLKYKVGIKRSNLDGTDSEILLSDRSSEFFGVTIEPASGNLYYGDQASCTIRVCDNDAKKCSTIANSDDLEAVQDVAVHLSKGLLFWSIQYDKVVRANLDGSNATVLLEGAVYGLDVDELEDRLYWGSSSKGIASCDLNGQDIRELPMTGENILDVAIDNEKVYFGNSEKHDVRVTSKLGTNSTMVKQLGSYVNNIALFGTRVSNRPANPCAEAKCAHLCVLITRWTYRCTCPDGQVLNKDGKTCNI